MFINSCSFNYVRKMPRELAKPEELGEGPVSSRFLKHMAPLAATVLTAIHEGTEEHEDELAAALRISVRHLRRIIRNLETADLIRMESYEGGKRGRPRLEMRPTSLGSQVAGQIAMLNLFMMHLVDRTNRFMRGVIEDDKSIIRAVKVFDRDTEDRAGIVFTEFLGNISEGVLKGLMKRMLGPARKTFEKMISGENTVRLPILDLSYPCPDKACLTCRHGNARRIIVFNTSEGSSTGMFCFFGQLNRDLRSTAKRFYAEILNQMLINRGIDERTRRSVSEALGVSRNTLKALFGTKQDL